MPAVAEFRSEPSGGVIFSKNEAFTQPFNMGLIQMIPTADLLSSYLWKWLDEQTEPDRVIGYFWLFNVGDTPMQNTRLYVDIGSDFLLIPTAHIYGSNVQVQGINLGNHQGIQFSVKVQGTHGTGIVEQVNTDYQKNSSTGVYAIGSSSDTLYGKLTPVNPDKCRGVDNFSFRTYSGSGTTMYDMPTEYLTYFQIDDIPPGCGRKITVQFNPLFAKKASFQCSLNLSFS